MPLPFIIPPGTRLYKYELTARIGGGGFGDVWLATDTTISRSVAVKVLEASTVTIDERLQEARIGNQLNHQNLVKIHYADVVNFSGHNLVLIAMDYHPAGSVLAQLNAGNFLPLPQAKACLIDILRGLEYLHHLGLYHSDVKPNNILLGSSQEHVLTDYGISCHSPTHTPVTPRSVYRTHIAPEVIVSGHIDAHTDIYQAGLTGFRLLNGIGTLQDKFDGLGEAAYQDLVKEGRLVQASDYQPFVPPALKRVINRAIAANPADRYQSALEMRRALEALAFPGYWTCAATGQLIGHSGGHQFHFEELALPGGLFNFRAFKTNGTSRRVTNVAAYSGNRITRTQVDDLKKKFMQFVATGNP